MTTKTILLLLGILAIAFFMIALSIGMRKQDIIDCLTWREQASEIQNYWLTKNQKFQCDSVGVDINNIPIK